MLGDAPWYVAGRRYGYRVLQTLCRIAIEPDSCVRQTEGIFERWGPQSIMVAKYIPGFSTVAPPLAGAMRLSVPLFIGYSAIAATVWAAVPIALGAAFHAEIQRAMAGFEAMGTGAAAAIAAVAFLYVAFKLTRRYMLIRFLRTARIGADELRSRMQQPDRPVVLDVRSLTARRLDPRRIPGAVLVDIAAADQESPVLAGDRDVVVYCS